jgi:GR25 family glycosyltransferase involved in LPS biosynthesis
METYVIALEGSQRLATLEGHLRRLGIRFSRAEAVDGGGLNGEELATLADVQAGKVLYGTQLTSTQVGCSLSHRAVYAAIVAARTPWALVLEDDAYPDEKLEEVLTWVAEQRWFSPTVIELYTDGRINASSTVMSGNGDLRYQKLKTFPGSTVAYLINLAAAERALAHIGPIASRADWPAWAAEVEFWRAIPNVVAHGAPGVEATSTMVSPSDTESRPAKTIRWLGLATGFSYLRLRNHYPGGVRQYYRHAVKPTALYWSSRLSSRGR